MPINRENVPEEFADALLGEADCFVSLPEVKELILPSGLAWSAPELEVACLKAEMLGEEYGNLAPTAISTPVSNLKPPCRRCSCPACMTGDCVGCSRGIVHPELAPPEDDDKLMSRVALKNARATGCLSGEQLAALETYAEGKSKMQKHTGLRVRRIVPPSREDTRFRVEFDAV